MYISILNMNIANKKKIFLFSSRYTLIYLLETRTNLICYNYIFKIIIRLWKKYVKLLKKYRNIHYLLNREING